MLYVMGDIHGFWEALDNLSTHLGPDDIVVQVGDFGVDRKFSDPDYLEKLFAKIQYKLIFIEGNHEHFPTIGMWHKDQLTEIAPNVFYAPRGLVMELDGKLVGFLGGAESVDKAWRTPGYDWFPEERVQQEDVDLLVKNVDGRQLDILFAHSPPQFVIKANWPPINEHHWGLPLGWIDESAWKVSKAFWALKPKKLYCGHMHKMVNHDNIRILDINEVLPHQE
jgi:UDP-2,3-diacylglucosamine pyrophosphatase LpxH